jgi:hypothetical protein
MVYIRFFSFMTFSLPPPRQFYQVFFCSRLAFFPFPAHSLMAISVADPHRKNANADPGKNLNADADADPDADSCSY